MIVPLQRLGGDFDWNMSSVLCMLGKRVIVHKLIDQKVSQREYYPQTYSFGVPVTIIIRNRNLSQLGA